MSKKIKIELLPKDFIGTNYSSNRDCPLARAAKRYFKTENIMAGGMCLDILKGNEYSCNAIIRTFDIDKDWDELALDNVREEYKKDPKTKKIIYYVELTERKIK